MAGEKCARAFADSVFGRAKKEGQICRETKRDATFNSKQSSELFLYACPIAKHKKGSKDVELRNCGYSTKTTKDRLNKTLQSLGVPEKIVQKKGVWKLGDKNFKEGMKIKVKP